jgi:hypothetical protein
MQVTRHQGQFSFQMQAGMMSGGCSQFAALQQMMQLLQGMMRQCGMGNMFGGRGQGQFGCQRQPNFGQQCPQHGGMGQTFNDFHGCQPGHHHHCQPKPHCEPRHHHHGHHHHHGGHHHHKDINETKGNPKKWYFKHGKYKKQKTEGGMVMSDAKTRIEYNKKSKTGHVYAKVEGQWQLKEVRKNWGGKAASPILLDMDGNGKADVKNGEWKPHAGKGDIGAKKINFDLNGDGKKELTEWTGGKDGLLLKLNDKQAQAYQKNGSLEVSGKELYGDQGGKYKDGYEKMRKLSDADGNGKLSGDELKNHYVWMDKDRDGTVDKGEMRTAQKAGITSVNATHNGDYQSQFEMNGEKRKTWDWWPTTWG